MTRQILWQYMNDDPDLHSGGIRPPAYPGDAGFDLVAAQDTYVRPLPGEPSIIQTGIRLALPEDMMAIILPRSGAWRRGILVTSALIDSGYRGEILVGAYSMSGRKVRVLMDESIAQLVPLPLSTVVLKHSLAPLPPSLRGSRGFGSTGR